MSHILNSDSPTYEPVIAATELEILWSMRMGGIRIADYLRDLIKSRRLKIIGDDSHMSVRNIKKYYDNIDLPRDYSFQDKDVYEKMAIDRIAFHSMYEILCDDAAVISGKIEANNFIPGRVCCDCNQPIRMSLKGETITLIGDSPCQSNSTFDITLNFPTGEIIAGDFPVGFHEWFNHPLHQTRMADTYTEGLAGTRETTERWAKEDIGHFFVGNTCPNVKLAKGGIISIRPDEKDEPGRKLTNICTDLWWVTLVDVFYWKKMMSSIGKSESTISNMLEQINTLKIKKGTYSFRYESNSGDDKQCRRITGSRIK